MVVIVKLSFDKKYINLNKNVKYYVILNHEYRSCMIWHEPQNYYRPKRSFFLLQTIALQTEQILHVLRQRAFKMQRFSG